MKYCVLMVIGLLLVGCGTSRIERLSKQCLDKDASFVIEINQRTGLTKLTVAAPRVGYSVKAGDVSVIVPTNVTMSVQHLVFPTNSVIMPSTNSVKKP